MGSRLSTNAYDPHRYAMLMNVPLENMVPADLAWLGSYARDFYYRCRVWPWSSQSIPINPDLSDAIVAVVSAPLGTEWWAADGHLRQYHEKRQEALRLHHDKQRAEHEAAKYKAMGEREAPHRKKAIEHAQRVRALAKDAAVHAARLEGEQREAMRRDAKYDDAQLEAREEEVDVAEAKLRLSQSPDDADLATILAQEKLERDAANRDEAVKRVEHANAQNRADTTSAALHNTAEQIEKHLVAMQKAAVQTQNTTAPTQNTTAPTQGGRCPATHRQQRYY